MIVFTDIVNNRKIVINENHIVDISDQSSHDSNHKLKVRTSKDGYVVDGSVESFIRFMKGLKPNDGETFPYEKI